MTIGGRLRAVAVSGRERLRVVSEWLRLEPRGLPGRRIALLHGATFLILLLAALRSFLFGDGFIIYHNLIWPIGPGSITPINSVYSPDLWTNDGPDAGGYLRAAIDAPPIWLGSATGSPLVTEKLFLVYAFAVEYVLSFVAATLFLHWYPTRLANGRRESVRLAFVVLTFVNPAALQWAAGDLLPFLWAAPLLLIAILATLLSFQRSNLRYPVIAGAALGVGAMLDPRLFVWGWFALAGIFGFALLVRRDRLFTLVRGATTAIVSLPGAALTFLAYSWAGAGTTPVRTATGPLIAWLSTNAGPLRVFELLGYFITEISYAPPSVYAYGSPGALPSLGSPTYLVLPPDPVTAVWLLALAGLPILAFSALFFREDRRYTLPFATIALAAIAFAGGSQIPLPGAVRTEVALGGLPIVGAAWQTVVGVPIYLQVMTEAAYLPLLLIATLGLVRWAAGIDRGQRVSLTWIATHELHLQVHVRPRRAARRRVGWAPIALVLVVSVLLLGSWQFFTGSYYPGGYSVGASPSGVPGIGSSAPVAFPASDVGVMTTLARDPAPYAIYWPGAVGFTYAWSARSTPSFSTDGPKPLVEPPGLAYLITHNLTADTASLLAEVGARYVVVDNMSPLELVREFGTRSLSQVVQFFESSPGLSLVTSSPPDMWEFSVAGAPALVAGRSGAVAANFPADLTGVATEALAQLGLDPAFLPATTGRPSGTVLAFNGAGAPPGPGATTIATASNLSEIAPPDRVVGFVPGPNLTAASFSRTSPGESGMPAPYANWTVSAWSLPSGTLDVAVDPVNGWSATHPGSPATASLNYLSSLVTGSLRGIAVDPTSQVTFNVSVDARITGGSTGTGTLNIVASNATGVNLQQLSSAATPLTTAWSPLRLSGSLPVGTSYFTLRTFTTFTGSVQLSNVSIGWTSLAPANGTFSGSAIPIAAGTEIDVPLSGASGTYDVAVDANGSGSLSVGGAGPLGPGRSVGASFGWIRIPGLDVNGRLEIRASGNATIAGVVVYPGSLATGGVCDVSSLGSTSVDSFSFAAALGTGCELSFHEPWSARWSASGPGGATVAGTIDAFGQTLFAENPGAGGVSIAFDGGAALPAALAAVTGVLLLAIVAAVLLPERWVRLPSRWRFVRK